MKILIELPSWLGDTIMATPALENIFNYYKTAEIILIGSNLSVEVLKSHPNVSKIFVLNKNVFTLLKYRYKFGELDIFISFRGSYRSKLLRLLISSKLKYQFDKTKFINSHQVEKYNNFINYSLNINSLPGDLILSGQKLIEKSKKNKILGLNPGASYGSAKRWYPEKFAEVAFHLSSKFDIVIFGGKNELDVASDIEKYLIEKGVTNYKNLSGNTSVNELIRHIANLDLFITGDSGPMHIAAVYKIPTIAIFGPTQSKETSQWKNKNSIIVSKNLDCQPCMKRACPLKHHECMKTIEASDIIRAANRLS